MVHVAQLTLMSVFVLSAGSKMVDSSYVRSSLAGLPFLAGTQRRVDAAVVGLIGWELALIAALIGSTRLGLILAALTLVAFTSYLLYAFGPPSSRLVSCGCLPGSQASSLSSAYARNALLLGLTAAGLFAPSVVSLQTELMIVAILPAAVAVGKMSTYAVASVDQIKG